MALKFRRGTTAQKSGSLAFGEPYVNTSLQTLQIGLDGGDVTLSAITTGSNLVVASVSGEILATNGVVSGSSQLTTDFDARYLNTSGDSIVSGSSQVTLQSTTGFSSFDTALSTISGSLISSASAAKTTNDSQDISISNLNTFSGSQLTQNSNLATITGSLISSASAAKSTNDSQDISITNLNSATASLIIETTNLELFSASANTRFTEIGVVSGSLILSASNANGRLSAIEAVSGTFARTNSTNTFNGTQTVSGSLYVTQDLVVQGSSSIQNVSSSTLNIGTNLITVAVNQPSVRFGGIAVIDSGSSGASGSLLYDSVHDEFIFVHKGNGTNVTSSHFVLGPETIDNLGNENYLTNNRIPKGSGKEHLNDSQISDDGTTVSIGGALTVTGNITGPIRATNGVVSGSSQIDVASTTGDIALGTRTSGNYVASLVAGTNITLSNNSGEGATPTVGLTDNAITIAGVSTSLGGTISAATIGNAIGAFSGSAQVSGLSNAQLTNSTISGKALGTNLDALTIGTGLSGTSYNGSSAVTIANTGVTSNVAGTGVTVSGATGAVTISIGQSVATTATPTFGNLTINGTITATGDITAYYTSDRRHKNNIQTISNAVLKVKQLNGVTWEWNDDVNEVTKSTPKTGLIAQEVQSVLPQVVTERADGFLALDYSKMVGLLVEAIKEQQIQIDQLKAQIGSK
jgi:hypothetical protein